MNPLLSLLSEIVMAEYAQWMRYTYLSSLGLGLYTDGIRINFADHAKEELEHAELISRWMVDFGHAPPTTLDPVEQFQGSIEEAISWLADAEVVGIAKYNKAHVLAESIGLYAFINDIEGILSKEHEHLSELIKYIEPNLDIDSDDSNIIIVASKIAQSGRDLISYINYTLSMINEDFDTNSARDVIKSEIEEEIVPLYNKYKSGDESVINS